MDFIFMMYFQLWKTEYTTNKTTYVSGLCVAGAFSSKVKISIFLPVFPASLHLILPTSPSLCLTSGALLAPSINPIWRWQLWEKEQEGTLSLLDG